ncbi:MAG TPA: hypothetical protein VKS98_06300 [Chthoniobacterales bacterium]|nr:hypothetical protein [Chthoniobacterales bacterium]
MLELADVELVSLDRLLRVTVFERDESELFADPLSAKRLGFGGSE